LSALRTQGARVRKSRKQDGGQEDGRSKVSQYALHQRVTRVVQSTLSGASSRVKFTGLVG